MNSHASRTTQKTLSTHIGLSTYKCVCIELLTITNIFGIRRRFMAMNLPPCSHLDVVCAMTNAAAPL